MALAKSLIVTPPLMVMERTSGAGAIRALQDGVCTRLAGLRQEGAAKVRIPRRLGLRAMEAVLINTAGGLTGGDRFQWNIVAGPNSELTVTTQACEKIYRASADTVEINTSIHVGAGAALRWLPQETILFGDARLKRNMAVSLEKGASLLMVEGYLFGRMAMGEAMKRGSLIDHWEIRHDGDLVHREDLWLEGTIQAQLDAKAVLGGHTAAATVLMIGTGACDLAPRLRALNLYHQDTSVGVSAWPVAGTGKLLARITASDGYELRKRLIPILNCLVGPPGLPKIWTM